MRFIRIKKFQRDLNHVAPCSRKAIQLIYAIIITITESY
jgi:hypothetical protein